MSIAQMPTQAESGDGGEGADDPGPSRSSDEMGRPASVAVEVIDPRRLMRAASRAWVEARLAEALDVLGARGEVRVQITDDAGITKAHAERCDVPGVTDVITFDLSDGAETLDADLLVCADEAKRQATLRGWGAEREVLLYALHGTLHCLGFDDRDPASFDAMHAKEDEVLEAIGVGRTYNVGPARDAGTPDTGPGGEDR